MHMDADPNRYRVWSPKWWAAYWRMLDERARLRRRRLRQQREQAWWDLVVALAWMRFVRTCFWLSEILFPSPPPAPAVTGYLPPVRYIRGTPPPPEPEPEPIEPGPAAGRPKALTALMRLGAALQYVEWRLHGPRSAGVRGVWDGTRRPRGPLPPRVSWLDPPEIAYLNGLDERSAQDVLRLGGEARRAASERRARELLSEWRSDGLMLGQDQPDVRRYPKPGEKPEPSPEDQRRSAARNLVNEMDDLFEDDDEKPGI
jgi:hypothetical protein